MILFRKVRLQFKSTSEFGDLESEDLDSVLGGRILVSNVGKLRKPGVFLAILNLLRCLAFLQLFSIYFIP